MVWSIANTLTFLQQFCVDTSITKANLLNFIQLRYGRIYNKSLRFYKFERTFATVSATKFYYLSRELNVSAPVKFFNQSDENYNIETINYDDLLARDEDESEDGVPIYAAFVELCSVQRQPNDASDSGVLKIKSSSASDTTQKVTITGRATDGTNEFEVTEEHQLTGTTAITSTYTYNSIYDISKSDETVGYVSVLDSTQTYAYSIIDPYRGRSEYQKWRLWPTPDSADTIKYTGYRRPRLPQNDSALIDVPQDLESAFIAGLRADVHDINFDMIKAQKYDQLFELGLKENEINDVWSNNAEMTTAQEEYSFNELASLADIDESTDPG